MITVLLRKLKKKIFWSNKWDWEVNLKAVEIGILLKVFNCWKGHLDSYWHLLQNLCSKIDLHFFHFCNYSSLHFFQFSRTKFKFMPNYILEQFRTATMQKNKNCKIMSLKQPLSTKILFEYFCNWFGQI